MRIRLMLLTFILSYAADSSAQTHARLSLDWQAVAVKIVERLDLKEGEKVVLVAYPDAFEELVPHLRYAIANNGGVDLGVIEVLKTPVPKSWDENVLQQAAELARETYRTMFLAIDAAVSCFQVRSPIIRLTRPFRICFAKVKAERCTSTGLKSGAP